MSSLDVQLAFLPQYLAKCQRWCFLHLLLLGGPLRFLYSNFLHIEVKTDEDKEKHRREDLPEAEPVPSMKPGLSRRKLDRQLIQPSIQDIATAFLVPSDSRSHLTFAMTRIRSIVVRTGGPAAT